MYWRVPASPLVVTVPTSLPYTSLRCCRGAANSSQSVYAPAAQRAWRTFAAVAELAVVAGTLLYFRSTLVRLFMSHGAGLSPAAVASTVRRWVMWSRFRIAVSFIAWCAALSALAFS